MTSRLKVPMVDLSRQFISLEQDLINIFRRVGSSGVYVLGPELQSFEQKFSQYCSVPFSVGVGNATDGLAILLKALGVQQGDEVITAANSFIASGGAIAEVGAIPVFVDVLDDLNIDPDSVEAAITPRTKVIIAVHLTGRPAKMDKINGIADRYNLKVVEDAAQAVGAKYKDQPVGSLAAGAVFSLHPLKNLHVYGDGGVITLKCPHLYRQCLKIRNHGLVDRDTCSEWGRNSRLDELQAAIASYKLDMMTRYNERFRAIANLYSQNLDGIVDTPVENENEYCVYHNYTILCDRRDELQKHLLECGVDTKIRYPRLLSLHPANAKTSNRRPITANAERLCGRMLSLPIFPEITESEIFTVINGIRNFYKGIHKNGT